jgi:hypothetical protein
MRSNTRICICCGCEGCGEDTGLTRRLDSKHIEKIGTSRLSAVLYRRDPVEIFAPWASAQKQTEENLQSLINTLRRGGNGHSKGKLNLQ